MVMLCNTKYCRNVVTSHKGICPDCVKIHGLEESDNINQVSKNRSFYFQSLDWHKEQARKSELFSQELAKSFGITVGHLRAMVRKKEE